MNRPDVEGTLKDIKQKASRTGNIRIDDVSSIIEDCADEMELLAKWIDKLERAHLYPNDHTIEKRGAQVEIIRDYNLTPAASAAGVSKP